MMQYQIQFRLGESPWQDYKQPQPLHHVDWLRAQCHVEHPECDVRVVPAEVGGSFEDRRRWAIEQGPGGDHDVPYFFQLPFDGKVRDAWLRLAARWRRREFKEDAA